MNKIFILIILVVFCFPKNSIAAWTEPAIVISGEWGDANNQFGVKYGDSFDEYPTLNGILGDGSIVITDLANNRTVVYKADGTFKEKENWVAETVEDGMIRYNQTKYLLGCCPIGYDTSGNLWTGSNDKYALTDTNGVLISNLSERPLELGRVINEGKKGRIVYPDVTYYFNETVGAPVRDLKGNIYFISFEWVQSGAADAQIHIVTKVDRCSKDVGVFRTPVSTYEPPTKVEDEAPTWKPTPIAEYGKPIIGPNGDIYAWVRSKTDYKIVKWAWIDSPDDPKGGPDAPLQVQTLPSTSGVYLTWSPSPQDPGCVTGYDIERSTSATGIFSSLTTVPPKADGAYSFYDEGATAGATWYYKVKAKSEIGDSDPAGASATR